MSHESDPKITHELDGQKNTKCPNNSMRVTANHRQRESGVKQKATKNWTLEEDEKLLELCGVGPSKKEYHLRGKWPTIAVGLDTGRTAKQCRDRWFNQLRSGIMKGDWTADEEELIRDLYAAFGGRWSSMQKVLSNRTENDIKNKWNSMRRQALRKQRSLVAEGMMCPDRMTAANVLVGLGHEESLDCKRDDLKEHYSLHQRRICVVPTDSITAEKV